MQIDWFTVGAQVVNFLILVVLLKRFLYQPVIKAMERRELALAQSRQQAEDAVASVAEQAIIYQQKLREIERQKEQLLVEVRQGAEKEKEKLLQQLRMEVSEVGQLWRAEVDREKEEFLADARQVMGREMIQLLGKVLGDLADADLQKQVVNLFLQKLLNLSDDEIQKFKAALSDPAFSQIKLISSFEVPAVQQQQIVDAIKQLMAVDITLQTDIDPDLICGLVLRIPGGEVEWNIANYLAEIEDNLSKTLSAPAMSR